MSFPAYEEYKESGVGWLGRIPMQWEIAPLKRLAVLVTGMTPPTADAANYCESSEFPWMRPEDLDESGNPSYASKFLSEQGWQFARHVAAGSSLICCIGTIGKIGFTAQCSSTNQQITSAAFKTNKRFSYYALVAARRELEANATGNVIQILNCERLGKIVFPVPPTIEGSIIANFLDAETSKIDALVAEQRRLIELLSEKRQAVISHAVTKGLDRNVRMKPSGIEWLGYVPEHWEVRTLSSLTSKITNGYVGPTRDILMDEGVRYLQSLHIKRNRILFDSPYYVSESWSAEREKSILQAGDVLVVQTGDIGQVAVVPPEFAGCNCHALIILAPKRSVVSGDWMSWVLNSDYGFHSLQSIKTGALHPHLNCGNVKYLKIPLPPTEEQHAIVSFVLRSLGEFDSLIEQAEKAVGLLQDRRTALISAAVTGKIDVREFASQETV